MLIDRFLPEYDYVERHETTIRASKQTIYSVVQTFDFNESAITRWLFWLRGLTDKNACDALENPLTLREMTRFDFVELGEKPGEEILFGLIGKFWKLSGELQKFAVEDFYAFHKSGYAKAAWNFALEETVAGEMRVTTETRVQCLDAASRRSFGFYWIFIRPFSGLIRRELLRLIKNKAEAANR